MSARGHACGDLPRQVVARDVSRDREDVSRDRENVSRDREPVTASSRSLYLVLEVLGGLALLAAFALAWAVTS